MSKSKVARTVELPNWLTKAARKQKDKLPFDSEQQLQLIDQAQDAFVALQEMYDDTPRTFDHHMLKPSFFHKVRLDNRDFERATLDLYDDQLSVCQLYLQLVLLKGHDLMHAYLRAARAKELHSIALLGRAMLELAVMAADSLRLSMHYYQQLAMLKSNDPIPFSKEFETHVEDRLYKSIWGTRLGTGNLGDGNKNRVHTPLWGEDPITERESAINIVGVFKTRAKRKDEAKLAYKLYEILCDVVHPAALGFQIYLDEKEGPIPDAVTCQVNKVSARSELVEFISAASLVSASHACMLICEIANELETSLPQAREAISNRYNALDE